MRKYAVIVVALLVGCFKQEEWCGPENGVHFNRHIIHGNYRIIYQVLENQVIVVRIIHAARLVRPGLFRGIEPGAEG